MPRATRSVRPWFLHRRMVPKWIGCLVAGALAFTFPSPAAPWLFLIGVVVFFPSEYIVHRFVFHQFATRPAGKVVSIQHVRHHETPDELDVLFNHPPISLGVGIVYFLVYVAFTRDVGAAGALSFGNFVGLLYYEWVHFAAHRPGARPITPWGRYLKRYHLWHHYKNEYFWYGVTSPVFDHALGSYRRPDAVDKSPTVRTLVPNDEQRAWMETDDGRKQQLAN